MNKLNKKWQEKIDRLVKIYSLQKMPEFLEESGYKLTKEEKKVVEEWSKATLKMMETEKLFSLIKEEIPYAGYPNQNGCSTCCNYTGCQIR